MRNVKVRLGSALLLAFLSATVTTPVVAEGPERLVVRDLVGKGIDQFKADLLTQMLIADLQGTGRYTIYSREEIQQVLDQAGTAQKLGAECDTTRCILDFGAAMNADRVISGNVGKLGSQHIITLTLYNIAKGERENSLSRPCACSEDDLIVAVKALGRELLGLDLSAQKGSQRAAWEVQPADFSSAPSGAKIEIKGKPGEWSTPTAMRLSEGTYSVEVSKSDTVFDPVLGRETPRFRTKTLEVTIKPGVSNRYHVDFDEWVPGRAKSLTIKVPMETYWATEIVKPGYCKKTWTPGEFVDVPAVTKQVQKHRVAVVEFRSSMLAAGASAEEIETRIGELEVRPANTISLEPSEGYWRGKDGNRVNTPQP